MTTVDELFDRYRAAYRADPATDPRPFLDELSGIGRRELETLIEGFLATDPGREYDAAAFARFQESPLAQRLAEAVRDRETETWTTLLPAARNRAQLLRSTLVERLAAALGVSGSEEKVAGYYHRMEHGSLPPQGVSARVLDALSAIVDVPVERLRAAGQRLVPPAAAPGAAPAVFARSAPIRAREDDAAAAAGPHRDEPARDEVDELFTGG